ncbi:HD domain-containing protein [Xylanibacter muris]|uniref:HDIG domain-containing protein n=1 Tax=Xylanibacter muris TaxID=2736290 RepID=A0ABX2AP46_9BACT|nr:HD domain-containing protein [Xylanibacter muris]NPD92959.1 HDIG domain-containing protein [Xylanibacter muris]
MDYNKIILKYYPEDNFLRKLLIRHSRDVAGLALKIAARHPELDIDIRFVEEGAMLHDIGIFTTNAPGIFCNGQDPYILHGYNGAKLLRSLGYDRHARVCERHTGTGITARQIQQRNLPLPVLDFLPETTEEILICYADKFFSKSHPDKMKTTEEAIKSLEKFGNEGIIKFKEWIDMFG